MGRIAENSDRITFLGRSDDQVKVNGNRLELSTVDAQIKSQLGFVGLASVSKSYHLVAYVVAPEHVEANADYTVLPQETTQHYRDALISVLPAYAVPVQFVAMRSLPETKISQKVNS